MSDNTKVSDSPQIIQLSAKAKRRMRTAREEIAILESHYTKNSKPTKDEESKIAELAKMAPENVSSWFQNRRTRDNQKRKEHEKERSPSPMINCSSQSSFADTRLYSKRSYEKLLSDQQQLEDLKRRCIQSRKASAQSPPVYTIMDNKTSQKIGLDVPFVYHHPIFGIEAAYEQWERLHRA